MSFNPEITLGNLFTVIAGAGGFIGAYYALKARVDVFAALIEKHNERVERMENRHEQRLTMLENNYRILSEMVQQIRGQQEERSRWDGHDRRHGNEPRRR